MSAILHSNVPEGDHSVADGDDGRDVVLPDGPIRGIDFCNAPLHMYPYEAVPAVEEDMPSEVTAMDAAARVAARTKAEREEKQRKLQEFHAKLQKRVQLRQHKKHLAQQKKADAEKARIAAARSRRMARSSGHTFAASPPRSSGHRPHSRKPTGPRTRTKALGMSTPKRKTVTSKDILTSPGPGVPPLPAVTLAGAPLPPDSVIERQRVAVVLEAQHARASMLAHAAAANGASLGGGGAESVEHGASSDDDGGRTSGASSPLSWSWAHHQPDAHSATHGAGNAIRAQQAALATASMMSAPRGSAAGPIVDEVTDHPDVTETMHYPDEVTEHRVVVRKEEAAREREAARARAQYIIEEQRRRKEAVRGQEEAVASMRAMNEMQAERQAAAQERQAQRQRAEEAARKAVEDAKLAQRRRGEEAQRFIDALRKRALDRIEERGIEIPPLCQCSPGLSPLAAHWDLCANNCVFYKNPEEYSRALADLFEALDLV